MSESAAKSRNVPDFVCMGFQKCGTTTLFEIFRQHPGVVLCRDVKEPMYYRVPNFIQAIGRNHRFYTNRYFGHVSKDDGRLKGEINAGLTYTNCAGKVARNYAPDVRMIFIMRDPVSRCYSAYRYFLARGFLPAKDLRYDRIHGHSKGFDHYVRSVITDDKKRSEIMKKRLKYLVLSQSNYGTCIEEYLRYFPVENMKFIVFEEFIRDEHKYCRDIYEFIGIDDCDEIDYSARANEGCEASASCLMTMIYHFAKGFNYAFYEFLHLNVYAPAFYERFYSFYRSLRGKAMREDLDKGKVMPETRDFLMEYYSSDIKKLENIIERDLSSIWGN